MTSLKVCRIGDALGVVLPEDVLDMLGASEGDSLSFTHSPEGIVVSVTDHEAGRLRKLAADIMQRRSSALKVLAQ